MIRLALLWGFIVFLAVYSQKDWYKALCGLVLLMAVLEHPDMPKSIFGMQGLNPWNILLMIIVTAWLSQRRREGLRWDMPRHLNVLLMGYLFIVVVGFFRMYFDREALADYYRRAANEEITSLGLISEYLVNCVKWVMPGLLFYDGCRSRSRFTWALVSVLAVYFLLAIQVIKWMPLEAAISGEGLSERSLKILVREVGYHRVNLSMMLGGASWAIFCTRVLPSGGGFRFLLLATSGVVLLGQALTGGRMGYVTWAVVGTMLSLIRWRKYLVVAPVIAVLVLTFLPGVRERLFQGFDEQSRDRNVLVEESLVARGVGGTQPSVDTYTVTAGRTFAWPFVVEKIEEAPFVGYGRQGMIRTGITAKLWQNYRESFPHPHNAYLELMLDNGLLGVMVVFPFFVIVVRRGVSLFRDSRDPVFIATGGVALSLVLAFLVASFGSQTFYPREGAVGMWCAIGLMLRVWVERASHAGSIWQMSSDESSKSLLNSSHSS